MENLNARPANLAEAITAGDEPNWAVNGPRTFTGSKGVVLKLKGFNSDLVSHVTRHIPIPEPPSEYIEADRKTIKHTDDPEYRKQLSAYYEAFSRAQFRIIVLQGTEVRDIPEGVYPPEAEEWVTEIMSFLPEPREEFAPEIHPASAKFDRYIDWLMYYVLTNGEITALENEAAKVAGRVLEVDVAKAETSFRGSPRRAANP